jgi:ABC-type glutathione transport system ATPase component
VSALLQAQNVWVRFDSSRRLMGASRPPLIALENIEFSVTARARVGIVGESGAGKSTLAKVLSGLIAPELGTVSYQGQVLQGTREPSVRRAIQMVFQDPGNSLNPALRVRRTLSELLRFHALVPAGAVTGRCRELLDLVHLPARALDQRPGALSGGERQRFAIARALAVEPTVLIADEAVSALDTSVQAAIIELLGELSDGLGLTILLITHDLAVVRSLCDELLVMHRAQIVERGLTEEIFASPEHQHTKELLQARRRLGDYLGRLR